MGWLAGLDPGSERMWSGEGNVFVPGPYWFGEGNVFVPGPYPQESRLPTAVLRTPPTGLRDPQDCRTTRLPGLQDSTLDPHSLVAPGGPADFRRPEAYIIFQK